MLDLPFEEFMRDDIGAVKKIYQLAGLVFEKSSEHEFRKYLSSNPRGKYGRVVYNLERDFGVSPIQLQQRFSFYYERYNVKEVY